MIKKTIKILVVFVASCMVLLLLLYNMQEKLIFLPTQLSENYVYNFDTPFTEFNLITTDGATLNALHFTTKNPKGLILYFHGNAGSLERWGAIASYFTKFEYDVIVMDYRTFGKSTGTLSEALLYEDSQLFYDYAKKHFSEDNIIVYGRSLGTALATFVASKNTPKQLLLETPFNNLTSVAQKRFFNLPLNFLMRYKFPSDELIKKVKCPITIIHGTSDSVVPYELGKKLSEEIPKEQLTFITITGGEHKNLIEFSAYGKAIQKALK
ncbi:alpha/beta hydrolase [Jejudonia soesokkakensis]|uniref:Alpha/beta hydrolase n=1 Tax=Jejudonia soesokkakensis TaxID=1323432 RepID=A0ABW2MQX1_9FLAO